MPRLWFSLKEIFRYGENYRYQIDPSWVHSDAEVRFETDVSFKIDAHCIFTSFRAIFEGTAVPVLCLLYLKLYDKCSVMSQIVVSNSIVPSFFMLRKKKRSTNSDH